MAVETRVLFTHLNEHNSTIEHSYN